MFQYLQGKKQPAPAGFAVLDVAGVGFLLAVSEKTYGELAGVADNQIVKLYTYLNVREDVLELYGFFHSAERASFLSLIGVSGVGPKAALSILSILSPDRLSVAVVSGDAKGIAAANGIGLKTAQKIILELRDKFAKDPALGALSGIGDSTSDPADATPLAEAVNALVVLGYPRPSVLRAASSLDTAEQSVEALVRALLQKFGGQ